MPHNVELITTIAASLGLAMIMGFVATRMKMPPMAGYLLAGIIIGPATPGFVADIGLARRLADIGVLLLMFAAMTDRDRAASSPQPTNKNYLRNSDA